jgi:hypothetical protein
MASVGGREVRVVDATAANDPASLTILLDAGRAPGDSAEADEAGGSDAARLVAIYNHRHDRETRLLVFGDQCRLIRDAVEVVVTGDRPSHPVMRLVRSRRGMKPVRFIRRGRLVQALDDLVSVRPEVSGIVFCGNTKGLDVRALLRIPPTTNVQLSMPNH